MSTASMEFNLADIKSDVQDWPDGAYYARITSAEAGISKAGNPQFTLEFELHDENLGSASVRDWVGQSSDFSQRKAKSLLAALSDVGVEDLQDWIRENPSVRVDAKYFIGKECIVFIGKARGQQRDDGTYPMFTNIVHPNYAPLSEADVYLERR